MKRRKRERVLLTMDRKTTVERSVVNKAALEVYAKLGRKPPRNIKSIKISYDEE